MYRRSVIAALITAGLAVGLSSCGSDDPPPATRSPATTSAPTTTVSPFGAEAISDLGVKIERDNAAAVVEVVELRGGTPEQALAALLASEAETGWTSGLSMAAPATDIRDVFGWRFRYNIAADSTDAVRAATDTFMDNASTISTNAADAVAYALAVQHADPRGYNEKEHFYKNGETSNSEYTAALPKAQAAYAELRGTQ
ncbi:hypothetical protein [Rhodococcus globerulus]|uniref:hypothetical protein n=1 Tax=Rhodococcus globerulus TaxID=33008 RepID=UPI001F2F43CC|nr:hypothetical protein [Rhodococcus globerulus]MCE4267207.1 hypothetical protein [Rhodococcus globerulus]